MKRTQKKEKKATKLCGVASKCSATKANVYSTDGNVIRYRTLHLYIYIIA